MTTVTLREDFFRPYTMEEVNAMLDEAEADFEAGRGIPSEVVSRHLREDLEKELENKSKIDMSNRIN